MQHKLQPARSVGPYGRILAIVFATSLAGGCATFGQQLEDDRAFERAIQLHRDGRSDTAYEVYSSLQPQERGYPGVLINMGTIRALQGELTTAETLLVAAVELDPDSVMGWSNLGVVRYYLGRNVAARDAFVRATLARERLLRAAVPTGRVNRRRAMLENVTAPIAAVASLYMARLQGRTKATRMAMNDSNLMMMWRGGLSMLAPPSVTADRDLTARATER